MKGGNSTGRWWLVALFVYLGMIFVLSSIPGTSLKLGFSIWDKAAHALEYLPVGFFVGSWLIARTGHGLWPPSRVTLIAVLILAAAGGFDEIHQFFVPARNASVLDVLADMTGGGTGLGVACIFFRIRRRLQAQIPAAR